jgi:hypothetical protein
LDEIIQWLLEGDPAIRWQTLRDLLDAPQETWQAERERTTQTGCVAQLLALQDADGRWGAGIYSPKWKSTTYTLLNLVELGVPHDCPAAQRAARLVIDTMLGTNLNDLFRQRLLTLDRCIVGMILNLSVYFNCEDERTDVIVDNLLNERLIDGSPADIGGWNCRQQHPPRPSLAQRPHHSSFHTTINVLEGLHQYVQRGHGSLRSAALAAEATGREFMLEHRLYKSHRTGEVIDPRFTLLSFPPRWHYDVLRGLEYLACSSAPHDERLQDAIHLLNSRRRQDGRFPLQHRYAGLRFFDIERVGQPNRWNTLRALRVLKWRELASRNLK